MNRKKMNMELENLKQSWRDWDARLCAVEAQTRRMAAEAASGRIAASRRRLGLMARLPLAALCASSFAVYPLCARFAPQFGIPAMLFLSLFIVSVAVSHALFLRQLRRLDPLRQTVREVCGGVTRLRRCFLWGVAVKLLFAVPLLVFFILGLLDCEPRAAEFLWAAFALGAIIGALVFLRVSDEIAELRRSVGELE